MLIAALLAGAVGAVRFATVILHSYEHFHEVVLILKLGAYPNPDGVLEAHRQGRMEAFAQIGAYSICIVIFVASALGLSRIVRKKCQNNGPG
jgi:hypothetical protein